MKKTLEDAFNLFCGKKIGNGAHRTVFECTIRPDLVVKVETERNFANVLEWEFWRTNEHYKPVSKWLAPCEYLSPDGLVLLQRKVRPAHEGESLPTKLPKFITDRKYDNFGWLDGRLVACDYGLHIVNAPLALTRADFW